MQPNTQPVAPGSYIPLGDKLIPESSQPNTDPTTPIQPKVKDLTDERGQTGTLVFSGFISGEEYNRDLIGTAGLAVWDQMKKSDAAVAATLKLLKLPVKAAKFHVEPAGESEEDAYWARMVEDALFNRLDWEQTLHEMLTYLEMGHAVLEKVYHVSTFEGRTVITLKKLGFRKQKSIFKWTQSDGTPGISQITGTGGVFDIPAEKLILLTNEREGNNFAGVSVLRPAYKHWYIKDQLYQISALAHERQGLGVVHITPPDNADESDRASAIDAARNIRANEQSYIEVPVGWNIEWMDMKGHTTIDPEKDIQHHNRMIWTNILGQFMEMGSHKGSGGTQSSSQDQSKYLDLNLESIANTIVSTLQRQLIRQLIDLNTAVSEDAYPELKHSSLGETNITTMASAIAQLVQSNTITNTAETEASVRQILNLPELDERYADDYENRPKVANQTGGLDPAKNMGILGPDGKPMVEPAQGLSDGADSTSETPAIDEVTASEIKKVIASTDRILSLYDRD